jgi:hypothetical protein
MNIRSWQWECTRKDCIIYRVRLNAKASPRERVTYADTLNKALLPGLWFGQAAVPATVVQLTKAF